MSELTSTALATTTLPWWRFPPLRNALLAASIGLLSWGLTTSGMWAPELARWGYLGAIGVGGWYWIAEAIADLFKERRLGIEFLMLAATIGSIALGLWDEAVALVVLFAIAEGVEEYTHERTRAAVRALMKLVPEEAMVVDGASESRRPAETLTVGQRFRVRPGERIAADGRLVEGRSAVNQAAVTGESLPIEKEPGDEVFAGSINGTGVVIVEVTRAYRDNTLARMIHLVEVAQEEKGRAQQWIDRFGQRYTPAVFLVAILLVAVPWAMDLPVREWLQRAIVLLVAAAPCALVIATPIAMAAGIRRASRAGVLVKGGVHLEHLAAVRCVAFDKTGTLTVGLPRLVTVEPLDGDERTALAIAAGLEVFSRHPLAAAIVEGAQERGVPPSEVVDFQSLTGHGVSGRIGNAQWYLASSAWFEERGLLADNIVQRIRALQVAGQTVSLLGTERSVRAVLGLADSPRPEAQAVIRTLHGQGKSTAMLSGDHPSTAATVARSLGIDDVRGALKPEQKVDAVRELRRTRGAVMMVGDGVNDAPALAAADCSIAMGAAGSDAAIEAADVALMTDDLRKVPLVLEIAASVRRVSVQNIVLSIAVLVAMIPAAVLGLIGVTTAVIVHEAAELLAVANGLRAGKIVARAQLPIGDEKRQTTD